MSGPDADVHTVEMLTRLVWRALAGIASRVATTWTWRCPTQVHAPPYDGPGKRVFGSDPSVWIRFKFQHGRERRLVAVEFWVMRGDECSHYDGLTDPLFSPLP
eukprot:1157960-Rhodomonas_salina.1